MVNILIKCGESDTLIIETTTLDIIWRILLDVDNMPWQLIKKIFGYCTLTEVIRNMKPQDIIEKYYAWKEEESHIFHVGEEVKGKESGNLSWIICVGDNTIVTIFNNGHIFTYDKNEITKTGRFNKTLADIINGGIEKNCLIKDIEEDLR